MWFHSRLSEECGESIIELLKLLRDLGIFTKSEVNQFIRLDVTKDNYLRLIEISDYLLVEDIDPLVDKIVQLYNYDFSIIYTFSEAYKLNSGRIKFKHTRETLEEATKLYSENSIECYQKYGFSSYWDVSNVKNMHSMFCDSQFNGDISGWNVSNVTDMNSMFWASEFTGDISNWNLTESQMEDAMRAYEY